MFASMDAVVSSSRSRRLRNAAVKRRLFEASHCAALEGETAVEKLAGLHEKLDALEKTFGAKLQLLLSCWSPFTADWDCWDAHFNDDVYNPTPCAYGRTQQGNAHTCYLNGDAEEFEPACFQTVENLLDGLVEDKGQCGPRQGTSTSQEWKHDAAALVQLFYRSRLASQEEKASQSGDDCGPCAECGQPFGEQLSEQVSDACDLCGDPLHSTCLLDCEGPRGEYSLCRKCLQQREEFSLSTPAPSEVLESKPLRMDSMDYGPNDVLLDGVQGLDASDHDEAKADTTSPEGEALESRLDYMAKFLEGQHEKSDRITPTLRGKVLGSVKQAMDWRKRHRTAEQIAFKIQELDSMMMDVMKTMS